MNADTETGAVALDRFAILVVLAVAAAYGLALGLTYPLLAIILEGQGVSATLIGLNTAMTPLGIVISAPFIPVLARRFGALRLAIVCALATALLFAAIGAWHNLWWWFPLRLLLGAAIDSLYVISETWLLQLAGPRHRGKLIGLYSTMLAAGFAVGPFALALVGSEGGHAFGIGIAIMLATAAGLLALRGRVPRQDLQNPGQVFGFMRLAPMLLLAIGVVALFDQVALSLLPVYLLGNGMSEALTATALGVFVIGNVLLQYPIGWLSDRMSRRLVASICLGCVLVCCAVLPVTVGNAALWPVLFVLGSAGFGIYTVTLAELGDRFEGAMLLAGNAAFALMWGLGGIVGPPVTGGVMDLVGGPGLPLTLFAAFALLPIALRGFR